MKILQLTPKPPWPIVDGGCFAMHSLAENLTAMGHEVHVISISTYKHPFHSNRLSQKPNEIKFDHVEIDTKPNIFSFIKSFILNHSFQFERFKNKKVERVLQNALENEDYDLVILDGLMAGFYWMALTEKKDITWVYRSHNVEYKLMEERALNSSFPLNFVFNRESKRLAILEKEIWKKAESTWSISELDTTEIEIHGKCITIPFSLKTGAINSASKNNSLFHIGAMDWQPNKDGLKWFVNGVWPKVLENVSDAELHLAGKEIRAEEWESSDKAIVVHPVVEDSSRFMQDYQLMIIPLQTGSGIRIKILEALAHGKHIISTTKGVEGLSIQREEVIIADEASEMADKIIDFLKKDNNSFNQKGLELMKNTYSSENVQELMRQSMNHLLKQEEK